MVFVCCCSSAKWFDVFVKLKYVNTRAYVQSYVKMFYCLLFENKQKEENHKSPSVIDCEWMTDVGWIESVEVQNYEMGSKA